MLDVYEILGRYVDSPELLEILVTHSEQVAEMAVDICHRHPELNADEDFVYEASMLHDIGIVLCDAEGIHCHGTEPYIRHGICGAEILRAEGLERHARVAERHTGTGVTVEAIQQQNLPLPLQDFSPETIEEQIICYADKFFSKTKLGQTKTFEQALKSLWKFGDESTRRFVRWQKMFS